jgi:phage FluMu protein Com
VDAGPTTWVESDTDAGRICAKSPASCATRSKIRTWCPRPKSWNTWKKKEKKTNMTFGPVTETNNFTYLSIKMEKSGRDW